MGKKIWIKTEKVAMEAELRETKTANAIWDSLPIQAKVNTWGEEIYFAIPVKMGAENAVDVVKEGDLAYWPQGNGFCIFFGKTPVSTESEIKPASPVNLIGKLLGNPRDWKKVKDGEKITIERSS
jgi:hypothetical protein